MARLVEAPPKYSSEEWNQANHLNYDKAEQERNISEIIRDESARLANETDITTQKTQLDVNKKFQQRLNDIEFWKSELDRQYQETEDKVQKLIEYEKRLTTALNATEVPLHICRECLKNREKRVSIDLVHDDAEIQLHQELEVIEGVQALLKRTLDNAVEQIRLLRSTNYYLAKDIKDKFSALKIDNQCSALNNRSPTKYYSPSSVKIDLNSITLEEWEGFSNQNVLKAERECNSSVKLCSMIDEILQETHNDLKKQCENVDLALAKRIEETEKAKDNFTNHLKQVQLETNEMEENINTLCMAISEKEAPMQVSQTRLDTRSQRPNAELCRDRVQYKLIDEVEEITFNINRLKVTLSESEASLKALVRQQLSLKENIEIKVNTLMIDRDQNVSLRQQIVHKCF